jgi:microcystin-dependent protein
MADTLTPNYGWVKPEVGASAATWGAKQNGVFDEIDAQVFANQQAGLPVGGGCLWFTPTPPTNFLIADGTLLDTTTYATLFAVYQYRFGGSGASFALPPLAGVFPMGANATYPLATVGGEATHVLTAAELAAHVHPITQVAHTHTASAPAHTHADAGHGHPGSTAGDSGTHAHGSNLLKFVGSGGTLGVGTTPFNVTEGNTDASNAPGVNVNVAAGAANIQAAQPAITINPTTPPGPTATGNNAGGGAAHNNLPPYLAINFIVRYQ